LSRLFHTNTYNKEHYCYLYQDVDGEEKLYSFCPLKWALKYQRFKPTHDVLVFAKWLGCKDCAWSECVLIMPTR
jgi:hypothetical protein